MKVLVISATAINREAESETVTQVWDPADPEARDLEIVTKELVDEVREDFNQSFYGLVGIAVVKTWIVIADPQVVEAAETPEVNFGEVIELPKTRACAE